MKTKLLAGTQILDTNTENIEEGYLPVNLSCKTVSDLSTPT